MPGRDRVIVKEVRYPAVPEHEEPAVVRFQAIKEITDPPEEVTIDFTPRVSEPLRYLNAALGGRSFGVNWLPPTESLYQAAGLKWRA